MIKAINTLGLTVRIEPANTTRDAGYANRNATSPRIDRVIARHDGNEETRAIMTRLAEPIGEHVKRCLARL